MLMRHAMHHQQRPLCGWHAQVCIISADFWGIQNTAGSGRGIRAALKGGGGTATAYHLLAELLQERPDTHVSFLGATKDIEACQSAQKVVLCPDPAAS